MVIRLDGSGAADLSIARMTDASGAAITAELGASHTIEFVDDPAPLRPSPIPDVSVTWRYPDDGAVLGFVEHDRRAGLAAAQPVRGIQDGVAFREGIQPRRYLRLTPSKSGLPFGPVALRISSRSSNRDAPADRARLTLAHELGATSRPNSMG